MQPTHLTSKQDEAEIHRLIAEWSAALEAKDLDGLTAGYLPDSVMYDAIPPYKTVGKDAIREVWANCLPYFPEKFKSEHRDITIHVSGDIALVHGLHHLVPTPADDSCGQTWMRVTVGYRRINGTWKVVHEHISIPFNPMNNQAWMISNPDIADTPDYGCHFQFEGVMAAPVSKIYEALTTKRGIQNWWTESCDVGSTVGSQITVRFGPTFKLMRIESLQSDAVVQWQVIDSHLEVPGLARTDEWIGTKINFRLEPESDSATRVRMEHIGLTPQVECFQLCSAGWSQFLGSLKSYVETGNGTPYAHPAA